MRRLCSRISPANQERGQLPLLEALPLHSLEVAMRPASALGVPVQGHYNSRLPPAQRSQPTWLAHLSGQPSALLRPQVLSAVLRSGIT